MVRTVENLIFVANININASLRQWKALFAKIFFSKSYLKEWKRKTKHTIHAYSCKQTYQKQQHRQNDTQFLPEGKVLRYRGPSKLPFGSCAYAGLRSETKQMLKTVTSSLHFLNQKSRISVLFFPLVLYFLPMIEKID